jgi:glucose/arabinose dehydrogenase
MHEPEMHEPERHESRRRRARTRAVAVSCLALALFACDDSGEDFDVSRQIGSDPELPEPATTLFTDMNVAEVIGWQDGAAPVVSEGLAVTAYATDLVNPRTVHTLPNGDVLVVQGRAPEGEPVSRPKDLIRGWIMSLSLARRRRARATSSRCSATLTVMAWSTTAATSSRG